MVDAPDPVDVLAQLVLGGGGVQRGDDRCRAVAGQVVPESSERCAGRQRNCRCRAGAGVDALQFGGEHPCHDDVSVLSSGRFWIAANFSGDTDTAALLGGAEDLCPARGCKRRAATCRSCLRRRDFDQRLVDAQPRIPDHVDNHRGQPAHYEVALADVDAVKSLLVGGRRKRPTGTASMSAITERLAPIIIDKVLASRVGLNSRRGALGDQAEPSL